MTQTLRVGAIFLTLAFTLAACTPKAVDEFTNDAMMEGDKAIGDEAMMEDDKIKKDDKMMGDEAMMDDGQSVQIEMTARQWEFLPATVTVNEGDKVRLVITSADVDHGFAIPEFGVSQRLESGQITTVEFTADKKGTFSFFCNVLCGSGHQGMRGTLIVQ
jgi:heme/copper-type cytochrome/quinol oxidase subunit 2